VVGGLTERPSMAKSVRDAPSSFRNARASRWEKLRVQTQNLMENPNSSSTAYMVAVIILLLIILSSVTFCAETVEPARNNKQVMSVIYYLDLIFISVFTLEYLVRLVVADDPRAFVKATANVVDLVAIVPFYIELLVDRVLGDGAGGGFDLRFLRLARVFRIFKLSRYGHRMQLVFDALIESREILAMLSVNLVILVVVFSSITYYAEKDEENTKFQSIPATCWWCIVTVLTVGYGDMYPATVAGKVIATMLMGMSVIVMALPITIIGSCFSNSWVAFKDDQKTMERVDTLPKHFRRLFPGLNNHSKEWHEYNYSFRERNHELRMLNEDLQNSLDMHDYPKMQRELQRSQAARDNVQNHLEESLLWTSRALESVLNDIARVCKETKQEVYKGNQLLLGSEQLLKLAMLKVFHGDEEEDDEAAPVQGGLGEFSAVLILHIIGGRNLPVRDMNGTSDPFIIVQHGSYEEVETRVVPKSLNPMFDEHKLVLLRNRLEPLNFHVYDLDQSLLGQRLVHSASSASSQGTLKKKTSERSGLTGALAGVTGVAKRQLMGKAELRIDNLEEGVAKTMWLPLDSAEGGELRITALVKSKKNITLADLSDPEVWPLMCKAVFGQPVDIDGRQGISGFHQDSQSSDIATGRDATEAAEPVPVTSGISSFPHNLSSVAPTREDGSSVAVCESVQCFHAENAPGKGVDRDESSCSFLPNIAGSPSSTIQPRSTLGRALKP